MQTPIDDVEPIRPSKTRRAVMTIGAGGVMLIIVATLIINPTGSPPDTSEAVSVVPPFSDWVTFTSPDGRFSASFPGLPDHVSRPETIGTADVTTESFAWESGDAAVRFHIAYVDYPAGSLSTRSPGTIFANVERAITTGGDTIIASRDVSGSHPGHEFTLTRAGAPMTFRAWIAGDRAYEVGVEGGLADSEAFLDSFRISDP
jgi:hypothetical protein